MSVGQVPRGDFGLAEEGSPGRTELPGSGRASGRRGHLLLEKSTRVVLLGAAFPAPRFFYGPDSFLTEHLLLVTKTVYSRMSGHRSIQQHSHPSAQ